MDLPEIVALNGQSIPGKDVSRLSLRIFKRVLLAREKRLRSSTIVIQTISSTVKLFAAN